MAAKYIGWSTPTIYNALKQGRAPFGFAAENPVTHTYAYHISPGLLVKYKRGEMAVYPLGEIIRLFNILAEHFKAERDANYDQ